MRDGLAVAGLLFAGYLFVVTAPSAQTVGFDAYSYWSVDPSMPYGLPVGALGFFPYSPVAVRVFSLAAGLTWVQFWWLWSAVLVATLVWLGWRSTLLVLAFPPVAIELYHGNLNLLLAAAVALGFRYPAAWAFAALTKLTPFVGVLWFAVRREWRSLGIAVGVSLAITVVSVALDGGVWGQWLDKLVSSAGQPAVGPNVPIPLWLRLPAAVVLIAWGARTDRRWTVLVGSMLAEPVLWVASFSMLAALPALSRPELRERAPTRTRAGATMLEATT